VAEITDQDAVNVNAACSGGIITAGRGGHFARALAARRPDRISHAVSMGSDLQGMFGAWTPTLFAVAVARWVMHATGRARKESCLGRHCGCRFSHDFARPFPHDQVRLTSIYSKGDGSSTGSAR
jgi:triacylglycerol lipase